MFCALSRSTCPCEADKKDGGGRGMVGEDESAVVDSYIADRAVEVAVGFEVRPAHVVFVPDHCKWGVSARI